ncbi:MAG: 30S ribosome-binding factor RbfA [Rhodoblastus sp.]
MSRSHHQHGAEPSQRMLRVAELVRHACAEVISRGDISDPVLESHVVTIPRVKMSPDLKLATVFVMPLGGKDAPEVIKALDRHRAFLRGEIARKVNLRFAPDVRFRIDDSFDNSAKIDALLNSEKVRRDLDAPKETSPEKDTSSEKDASPETDLADKDA